jgi:antitoxin (DNA-binding transcriptional repressor) of toxin-antitoxin stability system
MINKLTMEVYTVKEWEDNFDALLERVENGEHIGVIDEEGRAAVMMPIDDELYRIYTEYNNEAQ